MGLHEQPKIHHQHRPMLRYSPVRFLFPSSLHQARQIARVVSYHWVVYYPARGPPARPSVGVPSHLRVLSPTKSIGALERARERSPRHSVAVGRGNRSGGGKRESVARPGIKLLTGEWIGMEYAELWYSDGSPMPHEVRAPL